MLCEDVTACHKMACVLFVVCTTNSTCFCSSFTGIFRLSYKECYVQLTMLCTVPDLVYLLLIYIVIIYKCNLKCKITCVMRLKVVRNKI